MSIFDDMSKLHFKYGVDDWTVNAAPGLLREFLKFRVGCINEELNELRTAVDTRNPEEIVDSLIDIIVFAAGTLDVFDVDGQKAWDEVLKANMAKEPGIKEGRPNPLGLPDLIKPHDWKAPSHKGNHGILNEMYKKERP